MSDAIVIGISDYNTSRSPNILVTYALGSCVGISLYDDHTKIGGMSHIMLPDSSMIKDSANVDRMRFADTAIADLVDAMVILGADRNRITAKIAGGANMFAMGGDSVIARIGDRNVESVKAQLNSLGIPLLAEDTGADFGRTVFFELETGKIRVQSLGKNVREL
ncbi:MAG: chemotaxis protein CheD [Clostridiales Family XIII bacterium]|jgi:chemotaxis protein CheD|nr:chemotaxis protein CheD [Clostridiales Family XIII bacterium]